MFTVLLAIIAVLVVGGTLFYFFYDHIDFIIGLWDWVQSAVSIISSAVPVWVLPWVVVGLGLAIAGIIIKLL